MSVRGEHVGFEMPEVDYSGVDACRCGGSMTAMSTATKEKLYISTSAVSAVDKRQKFCYNRIVANEERCPSGLWSWS